MFIKLSYISENLYISALKFHLPYAFKDILWGLTAVFCWALFVLYTFYGAKNLRPGEEHGSAKWGEKSDLIANKLIDRKYENNVLFTNSERMSLNTRQTLRNNNTLIIGGSGSGKTRFWVKPNILQMHTSFVITDPKGTLLGDVGQMLVNNGYKIKVFNTVDFSKSMKYNPFSFIRCEADIKVFVDLFISGTKEKGEQSADKFWENAERLLYMALVGYLYYFTDEENRNFAELSRLINLMEVREEDENFKNEVDYMFEEIEIGSEAFAEKYNIEKPGDEDILPPEPNNFAVAQYKKYKLSAAKTAKSILISCGVRLAPFDIDVVREMTMYDEMELDKLGDEKTALFIIIDDKISSFNFLCAIMYSQLFKDLCDKADNVYKGRLPVHVRCILDEFPNCGQIPDFEKIIAVIRSREISANVIVQNPAQIKKLYGENAKTIEGCCDSILFLGSSENDVNKYISEKVGKTTIDHKGTSTSKGQSGSYSVSDQI
ncbi:MAG: type IV secretory system conjugative DNA transfer family protein, partial [Clostridiales bacterium]|nr:type IV secretory system conjugative DNA transfer family protein [Clostridiales bacterium]